MKSAGGEKMALRSVNLTGRMDGLLLRASVQQKYVNETGKNLEIVYTFPLPWGATLLGLDAEIGGKSLSAVVLEKKEAEEKYEEAVAGGDTPMLLQSSGPGLYTANLGNIKDGESVKVEIHYAQLLNFEQGRIRLCIPTVLAPRYGDAHAPGRLAAHETDQVDLRAQYPLHLCLDILGEASQAKVSCPTHKVGMSGIEGGLRVELEAGAMLDRDFVLLLDGLAGKSFALSAPDGEEQLLLAGFCPKLPVQSEPLLLKMLVDCSGSMGGDSINQAKQALQSVLKELKAGDYVSYSRFGSKVRHSDKAMLPCDANLLQSLARSIDSTEADMGGTELPSALRSVCRDISLPKGAEYKPCVLLITDDLTWGEIERGSYKDHRIFAGVVSSAPSSEIRASAEQSGGACEFVTPNEDMSAAIVRMFRRMRAVPVQKLRLDWGAEPLWQTALPEAVFDGETLHVFAAFRETPSKLPELLWEVKDRTEHTCPEKIAPTDIADLPRLAAARRISALEAAEDGHTRKKMRKEALALALKYQLPCKYTSFFLVYEREDADKLKDLPALQQTPQMMAAGYGGFGSVRCGGILGVFACSPGIIASSSGSRGGPRRVMPMPSFERMSKPPAPVTTPLALLRRFDELVFSGADFEAIVQVLLSDSVLRQTLEQLATQAGLEVEKGLSVLLDWLQTKLAADFNPARQSGRLLRKRISGLDATAVSKLRASLEAHFQQITCDVWT
jgi:Ca-activated chloride channel family protein